MNLFFPEQSIILSPVCPFFTHHLSTTLYEKSSVDIDVFPVSPLSEIEEWTKLTDSLVEFNSVIWKAKKDDGISLAAPLSGQKVPEELSVISEALVSMHKLE